MLEKSSKCAVICYGYAANISDYFWELSICSRMPRFMAHISYISYFYISTIYLILLMVILCATHACLLINWNKCLPHSYLQRGPSRSFFSFRHDWSLFLALITICTRIFFVFICFLVEFNSWVDALLFLPIRWSNSILNCFVDVSNFLVNEFCSVDVLFTSSDT